MKAILQMYLKGRWLARTWEDIHVRLAGQKTGNSSMLFDSVATARTSLITKITRARNHRLWARNLGLRGTQRLCMEMYSNS